MPECILDTNNQDDKQEDSPHKVSFVLASLIEMHIAELCYKELTIIELAYEPILVLLLVNLRSGTRAKGSSNDKIICIYTVINVSKIIKTGSHCKMNPIYISGVPALTRFVSLVTPIT